MADYKIEKMDGYLQLTLTGDLTAAIVPALQASLREALVPGVKEVVADLAATTMLDSSGIGLLISISNTLIRGGGRIRVINVSADIQQLLQSMRLNTRLNTSGRQS